MVPVRADELEETTGDEPTARSDASVTYTPLATVTPDAMPAAASTATPPAAPQVPLDPALVAAVRAASIKAVFAASMREKVNACEANCTRALATVEAVAARAQEAALAVGEVWLSIHLKCAYQLELSGGGMAAPKELCPHVIVTMAANQQTQASRVVEQTCTPVWDEWLSLKGKDRDELRHPIRFELRDQRKEWLGLRRTTRPLGTYELAVSDQAALRVGTVVHFRNAKVAGEDGGGARDSSGHHPRLVFDLYALPGGPKWSEFAKEVYDADAAAVTAAKALGTAKAESQAADADAATAKAAADEAEAAAAAAAAASAAQAVPSEETATDESAVTVARTSAAASVQARLREVEAAAAAETQKASQASQSQWRDLTKHMLAVFDVFAAGRVTRAGSVPTNGTGAADGAGGGGGARSVPRRGASRRDRRAPPERGGRAWRSAKGVSVKAAAKAADARGGEVNSAAPPARMFATTGSAGPVTKSQQPAGAAATVAGAATTERRPYRGVSAGPTRAQEPIGLALHAATPPGATAQGAKPARDEEKATTIL